MTPPSTIKLALAGASGRMGRMIIAAVQEENKAARAAHAPPPWELVEALAFKSKVDEVLSITNRAQEFADANVVIDFSHGSQAKLNLEAAAHAGKACFIGTTPFPPEAQFALLEAGKKVPVMYVPNASDGYAVLAELVVQVARALDESWDIEILDFHHAEKLDAPSGTAGALARIAQVVRHKESPRKPPPEIESTGDRESPRYPGTIGTTSLRGGTTAGEHRVIFAGNGERLEFHHIVHDRTPYARGALRLARMLAFSPPGVHRASLLLNPDPPE